MIELQQVPLEDLVAEIHRRRRLIDRIEPPARPETHRVVSAVCRVFNVEAEDLFLPTRKARVVEPRQCAMALLRRCMDYTFEEAAGVFGLDHGTAIHALRCHDDRMKAGPKQYRDKVEAIEDLIS